MDIGYRKGKGRLQVIVVVLFVVISIARIVSTYSVFSQTWDEPVHVASGMEWLQQGTYTYEDLHPPLARIAVAIGPYLSGIRLSDRDLRPEILVAGGNAIFSAHGKYLHNLTLARLGVLPFFLVGVVSIWYWTRRVFDGWAAVAAVGLFTSLPIVLGHAGVATTDLPITATFALALFSFTTWLERPTRSQTLLLGGAVGLAVLTKFSALLFLPACGLAVVLCWLFASNVPFSTRYKEVMPRLRLLGLAAVMAAVAVVACYRCSFHTVTGPEQRPHQSLDRLFGHQGGRLHDLAYDMVEGIPVPVPEFFHGIAQVRGRASSPTPMYLLGEVGTEGWWYFFPVALIVKTPVAFLILMFAGALGVVREWKRAGHDWRVLVPLASASALLLVCLPSKFNIGLRHILPIYPFLSILAGLGIVRLWREAWGQPLRRIVAGGLAAWMLISTAMAQPDCLAYFNEFAGNHPERILVDSDLDWGQDLLRLGAELHARGVAHVAIAYNGSADLQRMNLPPFEILAPCARTTGWIAVSLFKLEMSKPSIGCGGFSWLESYEPVALVGKSIRLYWIPNNQEARLP